MRHDYQTHMDAISFMEVFQRYFPEKERRFIFSPGRLFWQNAPEERDLPSEGSDNVLANDRKLLFTRLGDPVRSTSGFPLKTCGNDGLKKL
jgi:hypothetical protein